MKSRIKIPEHITDPREKRIYLLSKGECLSSSDLFDGFDKLKSKCEATFVILQNGNTVAWGVGRHRK